MCLIFLALNQHRDYKLIIAANRDEFYKRKTAPLHFWEDYPHVVGGRDLEASGTWMAMTRHGKIGIVTNYRDPANINPNAPSRGQLVSDFLIHGVPPDSYLQTVSQQGAAYNGFNLITGSAQQLWYYSNYGSGIHQLTSGIYGLSNHLLDTPWPKVSQGKEKFAGLIRGDRISTDTLLEMLYDQERAQDPFLPDTGIGLERERALSSMFIKTHGYGTRCSTVVMITHDHQVNYSERVYDLETFDHSTKTLEFRITE